MRMTGDEASTATRLTTIPVILLVLGAGISSVLWGEVLIPRDDLAHDQTVYANIVKSLPKRFGQLNDYRVQRLLPLAIVHYGMRAVGIPLENKNIALAFQVYNLCLLVLIA